MENYIVTLGRKQVGTYTDREALIKRIKEMYSNHPAAIHVIDSTPFDELIQGVNADRVYKIKVSNEN